MGWEYRGRRQYYYRPRRRDGRVVREYLGRGTIGAAAARLDAEARARREAEARALASLRVRLEGPQAALDRFDRVCVMMLDAALLAAGYRRLPRRPWRKRRTRRARRPVTA
jgi:hypothetical protein